MTTAKELIESRLSRFEFIAMVSMLMAVTALATDMMLPAFGVMREHFGVAADSNALAPVVTFFFLGFAVGQLLLGPMSDAFGRKPLVYGGLAIYIVAAIAATFATTLPFLFAVRFLGGVGAAGVRVAAIPIVRDAYVGQQMAKVMSFIMAVFILVPVVAPTVGAIVLALGTWETIFWSIALFGFVAGLWSLRMPETLAPDRRIPLSYRDLSHSFSVVVTNRFTMGLTLGRSLLFGFFASYLASSQLIIDDVFDLDAWFPLIFAAWASVLGIALLLNTRLLDRFPLRSILRWVLNVYVVFSLGFFATALATGGTPPFWLFFVSLIPLVACHALIIPNLTSASMIPMGAVAGTATAVVGALAPLLGAIIGAGIDLQYDGTILPLATASAVLSVLAYGFYRWSDAVWERETAGHDTA